MFGTKKFTTIIMDGSNENVNREITGIIDMVTRRRIGRTKCRKLDKNHPTMKVFKRRTSWENYRDARMIIEKNYPGLCTFYAKV